MARLIGRAGQEDQQLDSNRHWTGFLPRAGTSADQSFRLTLVPPYRGRQVPGPADHQGLGVELPKTCCWSWAAVAEMPQTAAGSLPFSAVQFAQAPSE